MSGSDAILRVLFVDDEPNVLAALRRTLHAQRGSWDLRFASSGEEALSALSAQAADVLVCDLRMPGLDGAELLGTVRDRWPETVRIVLTGHADRRALLAALPLTQRYLLKPCRAEDLRAAIGQVVEARAVVRSGHLQSFLAAAETLPQPPGVYAELIDASARPECEVADLVRVLEKDVATASEVLRLVNSGLFCPPSQVLTLGEAIVLLGFDGIEALALASAAFRAPAPVPAGFDLDALARHSMLTAAIARRLAAVEGADRAGLSTAFLAGVLHNIGLLVQVTARPAGWAQLRAAAGRTPDPWQRAELEVTAFGCTTAQASAYLLGLWGFAEPIVRTVLAQPVRNADALATPTAHMLAYARAKAASEPVPTSETGYLTVARQERWEAACADLGAVSSHPASSGR